MKFKRFSGNRMFEAEPFGVEHDARHRPAFVAVQDASVGFVTEDRMPEVSEVDPDLVGSSRV